MKVQITNYSFDASAKTITFNNYVAIKLESILSIINVKRDKAIYNPISKTLGGTVAGNVLTLEYDTSIMGDNDELQIFYDDDEIGASSDKQDEIIENQTDGSQKSQIVDSGDASEEVDVKKNTDDDLNLDELSGLVVNGVQYFRINADKIKTARMDASTHSIQVLDYPHHEIHSGSTFKVSHANTALANNGSIIFVFTVNTPKEGHFIYSADVGGNATLTLYAGSSGVSGGTPLTVRNKNRVVGDGGNQITALQDPTVTLGNILEGKIVPGGTGGNASGGSGSQRDEWVLLPGVIYSLVLTNIAGATKPASLTAEWYEHTPKD